MLEYASSFSIYVKASPTLLLLKRAEAPVGSSSHVHQSSLSESWGYRPATSRLGHHRTCEKENLHSASACFQL